MRENCSSLFIGVLVFLLALGLFAVMVDDGKFMAEYEANQPTPMSPSGPGTPNLQGFVPVEELGITWSCADSAYNFQGKNKQVITASGNQLLFICNSFGEPLVKFCENGVSVRSPGTHDSCK
jgi:hypothetical protein